ncbi:MAG: hypothetical protein ABEI52_04730 [Halobacteriaceae archaeon]
MARETLSKWSRRYVLASIGFLLIWQVGTLGSVPRHVEVILAINGFVFHMIFGKAYTLVPSYFERDLAVTWAPPLQLPLTIAGVSLLAFGWGQSGPAVTVGAIAWAIRDNITGRETGTGPTNEERRTVDRIANGFVVIALLYLGLGTVELVAGTTALPGLFDGALPRIAHLFAAGAAALMVFALGFRLLPRFLVVQPALPMVVLVLLSGAIGPILLAITLWRGPWFAVAGSIEFIAVVGFATEYVRMFVRSDRDRVGFYGVLAGAFAAVIGVGLGLSFTQGHAVEPLVRAHLRLNLLGFLGLTIVGVAYQFYPPRVGRLPAATNQTAHLSIWAIFVGLLVEVIGLINALPTLATLGNELVILGTFLYAYLIVGAFTARS